MKLRATILGVVAVAVFNDIDVTAVKLWQTAPAAQGAGDDANATGNETAAPAQEIPPEAVFMPACIDHVSTLVVRLHASYTYTQIPTVLEHWCMEENYTHRFENNTVCDSYAKLLAEAHVESMGSDNKTAFSDLCKKYYDEEMVAKADSGTWLWAKGEDALPSFEDAAKDNNATAALEECSNKMKGVMSRLHNAYTYNQLPMTLMNACQGHHKWSSVAHKTYCRKLVHHLMKAHEQELEGKTDGAAYGVFCETYNLVEKSKPLESAVLPELLALSLIAVRNEATPTVASMRTEAHTRRLRADGKQEQTIANVDTLVKADTDQLLYFLVHPETHDAKATDHATDAGESANVTDQASANLTVVDSDLPPLDVFLPACLRHTKKLMKDLPEAYTVEQLPDVLEHACELDEDIHGFNDEATCEDFAKRLVKAHVSENKDEGYTAFCREYYVHKGGAIVQEEIAEEEEEEAKLAQGPPNRSLWGIIAILSVITVFTVVGTIMNLKKK